MHIHLQPPVQSVTVTTVGIMESVTMGRVCVQVLIVDNTARLNYVSFFFSIFTTTCVFTSLHVFLIHETCTSLSPTYVCLKRQRNFVCMYVTATVYMYSSSNRPL